MIVGRTAAIVVVIVVVEMMQTGQDGKRGRRLHQTGLKMMMMAVGCCRADGITAHHLAGQSVAGQHFVSSASHVTVRVLWLLTVGLDAAVRRR